MTSNSSINKLMAVTERVGLLADSAQRKLRYIVIIGLLASAVLAFLAYSGESSLWWNSLKIVLLMLPAFIWAGVIFVLNQLREAPELVSQLVNDDLLGKDKSFSLKEPDGFRGLLSTVKAFKEEDGFEVVFDTISGIGLILNPFFVFIAFIALVVLFLFIVIAPFLLLF